MTSTTPLHTPALPPRETPDELLAVEDAAFDSLTRTQDLTHGAALAIWEATQRFQTRDPLITRVLIAHPTQRTRALHTIGAVIDLLAPDAETLTLAATLTWAIGEDHQAAHAQLIQAQQLGAATALTDLLIQAIDLGCPPNTWLIMTAETPLSVQRQGTPS